MKKLGKNIEYLIANLAADSDQARINMRAHQVRSRYREVIESIYPNTAQLFLDHTNNVYIMKKDDVPTLIVYVDESIYAAELNAQRELIRLRLLEKFGEQVEEFEIYVSRGQYKTHYPFREDSDSPIAPQKKVQPLPDLDSASKIRVEQTSAIVEDERIRKSFEEAMTADMARNLAENGIGS